MPALPETQRLFAAALLAGDASIAGGILAAGHAARIVLHRQNRMAALTSALAFTHPATLALVGDDYFAHAAEHFIAAYPATRALLSLYGGEFGDFLAGFITDETLGYVADVARLEWAVDQLDLDGTVPEIALPGVRLRLKPALALHKTGYAAEAIRSAVLADDVEALDRIDAGPQPGWLVLWLEEDGPRTWRVGAAAAAFLAALLAGESAERALELAAVLEALQEPGSDPIARLTHEVLRAPFLQLEEIAA